MKSLLMIVCFFLGLAANAQTYAPYTGNKAKTNTTSRPAAATTKKKEPVAAEKTVVKEEANPKADFEDLMNKAVEQLHQKDYLKSESFYTQALGVSTEKNAWRALQSRATLYAIMKEDKKAIGDLTAAIKEKNTPKPQLAIIYATRARIQAANKNMDLACSDIAKAKALGVSKRLINGIECK